MLKLVFLIKCHVQQWLCTVYEGREDSPKHQLMAPCDFKTGYVSKLGTSTEILTYITKVMGTPEPFFMFKAHHASLTNFIDLLFTIPNHLGFFTITVENFRFPTCFHHPLRHFRGFLLSSSRIFKLGGWTEAPQSTMAPSGPKGAPCDKVFTSAIATAVSSCWLVPSMS